MRLKINIKNQTVEEIEETYDYAIEVLKTQLEKDKKLGYIRSLSVNKLQQAIELLKESK